MKFNLNFKLSLSEGKKRLRILISSVFFVLTYLYLIISDDWVKDEEFFITYPFYSLLSFSFVFLLVTGVYWVWDGFKKDNEVSTLRASNSEVFQITNDASLEILKVLYDTYVPILKKITGEVDEEYFNSWTDPALIYAFGLTYICVLRYEPNFLENSSRAKYLQLLGANFYRYYKEKERNLTDEEIKSKKHHKLVTDEILAAREGAEFYQEQLTLNNKNYSPLYILNKQLANTLKLNGKEFMDIIDSAGISTLANINQKLRRIHNTNA